MLRIREGHLHRSGCRETPGNVDDPRQIPEGVRVGFLGSITGGVHPVPPHRWRLAQRSPGNVRGTAVSGKIKLTRTAYTRLYVRSATSYLGSVSRSYTTKVR